MTFMYVEDTDNVDPPISEKVASLNTYEFQIYAASALAGVCFVRNIMGGAFPLFGTQMYENLGYRWAGSLLGFLALVMMPMPFILSKWGRALRKRSKWAAEHIDDLDDEEVEAMNVAARTAFSRG